MPLSNLARALLDEPRWVETRWMLLDGRATVTGLSGDRRNFVVASAVRPLISVVGHPEHPFISSAAEAAPGGGGAEILVAEEHAGHAATALAGFRRVGATIQRWPDARPLPEAPPAAQARLLAPDQVRSLSHLPKVLHAELAVAAEYAPVAGAFSGGAPVAFCCASGITESLWDVGIETLEGFRRRGLATLAWRCLAAALVPRGKWPVWGAADDNAPSLAMASRLGFVPSGRLAIFTR